jgi:REP element-mobilizing transposase RayT
MNLSPENPGRQKLPHLAPLEFPNQTIVQYVTVCVSKRRQLLARPEIAQLLVASWKKADHWLVGRFVIMPDHLHLFCSPAKCPSTPLRNWISFWRNDTTRHWPHPNEKPIWQKDFFDRQLRTGESYHQKWLYLWENPIKSGLIKRPEDWPYQGELNVLCWRDPA